MATTVIHAQKRARLRCGCGGRQLPPLLPRRSRRRRRIQRGAGVGGLGAGAVGGEDFNASAFPFKKVLLASSRFQTQYGFATVGDLVPAQHLTTPKTPLN